MGARGVTPSSGAGIPASDGMQARGVTPSSSAGISASSDIHAGGVTPGSSAGISASLRKKREWYQQKFGGAGKGQAKGERSAFTTTTGRRKHMPPNHARNSWPERTAFGPLLSAGAMRDNFG